MTSTEQDTQEIPVWRQVAKYAWHVFYGSAMFLALGTPVVLFSIALQSLHTIGVDPLAILMLNVCKYAVLGVDVLLFLLFLGAIAFEAVKWILARIKRVRQQ